MKIATLSDLYLDQLRDMHSCEKQLIVALEKMARAAQHPELVKGFEHHLEETRGQLERLSQILTSLGEGPGREVCEATAGLVAEGAELIEHSEQGPVRDAGLICAAQKTEHYEIASYGCLCTYASLLDRGADLKLLEATLHEEKQANDNLTLIAVNEVNAHAIT